MSYSEIDQEQSVNHQEENPDTSLVNNLEKDPDTERFLETSKEFYQRLGIPAQEMVISADNTHLELTFTPSQEAQGYGGIAHGGYVATILDTGNIVTIGYAKQFEKQGLNADFRVLFKAPLTLDKPYKLVSDINELRAGEKVEVNSQIVDEENNEICSSKSLIILKPKQ